MLPNPCPRPAKHLTDVPVIHLGKRIGITRSQEFRVRRPSEVASHNLYFAAPQEVCQPRQGCRSFCHAQGGGVPILFPLAPERFRPTANESPALAGLSSVGGAGTDPAPPCL